MNSTPKVDYSEHPAFPSAAEVFSISEDFALLFESLYSQFSDPAGAISTNAKPVVDLLESLFDEWKLQCHDGLEVLFVNTLETMSVRVLEEQNDFFAWQRANFSSGTESATTRSAPKERYVVGELSVAEADRLSAIAASEIEVFRKRANLGLLKRSDLSIGRGRTVNELVHHLNSYFNSNGMLEWTSESCGTDMVVAGLSLELSDSRSDWWRHAIPDIEPPKTMYAHVDEAIGVPKAIVYLSDVGPLNGPTSCYPGLYEEMRLSALSDVVGRAISKLNEPGLPLAKMMDDGRYHQAQSSLRFRQLFMRLPSSLRFYSHLGWDVVPGSQLETDMVHREEFLLGRSGTFIVFDGGRLFHRGGLIEEGDRVALQVIFRPRDQTTFQSRVKRKINRILDDWKDTRGHR
jgi:hypothetical protein